MFRHGINQQHCYFPYTPAIVYVSALFHFLFADASYDRIVVVCGLRLRYNIPLETLGPGSYILGHNIGDCIILSVFNIRVQCIKRRVLFEKEPKTSRCAQEVGDEENSHTEHASLREI